MENQEYVEINGVYYIRLHCCDPESECPFNRNYGHFWKHHDCDGDIYINDNAHLLCKRCGQIWPIVYSEITTPFTANVKDYYFSQSEVPNFIASRLSLSNGMVRSVGIMWLKRFLTSLEKQLSELSKYGKDKPI